MITTLSQKSKTKITGIAEKVVITRKSVKFNDNVQNIALDFNFKAFGIERGLKIQPNSD